MTSVIVESKAKQLAPGADLGGGWLVAALATLALLRLRAPQMFTHPQLWAEDGLVFYHDQALFGASAILQPYVGYLHLAPRLTAWVLAGASAVHIPRLYAEASVVIAMWSAATAATCRLPFAWLLGTMLILPPHTGEDFGTLTNVQWLMAPAFALALCTDGPERRGARLNQFSFCLLAGFTGPFSIFLAPIALWRGWSSRRDRYSVALCAIVVVAATIQGGLILSDPVAEIGHHDPLHVAWNILDRCLGQLATGGRTTTPLDVLWDAVVAGAAACALRTTCRKSFAALFVFLAAFMLTTWLRYLRAPPDTFDGIETGDRYFFIPRLMILWAIAMVLFGRHRWASGLAACALVIVAIHVSQWRKPPLTLMPWAEEARKIDRGDYVRILINPPVPEEDGPWMVELPARH